MRARRIGAVAVVLAALLLSGCAPAPVPKLSVSPASALFDRPLTIRLTGLASGSLATLTMTSTDGQRIRWSSSAVFRADGDGVLSTAQAPVAGDYRGARPMGLVAALHPAGSTPRSFFVSRTSPWRLTVTARVGGRVVGAASTTRERCSSDVATVTHLTLAKDGVLGDLIEPVHPASDPQPAVVAFGGSEGGLGMTTEACLLAAHGYPALAIAYFHAPGLPENLQRVPLETFERAAERLATEPHVDPRRIVLWGVSRGGEAALLAASSFPGAVHAAIGSVPNWETAVGLPQRGVPAWTLAGDDVPTGTQIPVERIAGPILLVCGGEDEVWPSCANAELVRARLKQERARNPLTLLDYPDAGHFVGSMLPDYPTTVLGGTVSDGEQVVSGGTALANAEAKDDAYPRLLAWMASLRRSGA